MNDAQDGSVSRRVHQRGRATAIGRVLLVLAVLLPVGAAVAFGTRRDDAPAPQSAPPSVAAEPEVLVGAGDIAVCGRESDEATARLLDEIPGTVFTVGDNVYEDGTRAEFRECYAPSWGRHRDRTAFPVAGNHDWQTTAAAGYTGYFGSAAKPNGTTWYSRSLGAWQVLVLDSNCDEVGGCDEGSPQLEWLEAQLGAGASECTIALFHHPRFSSGGLHGNNTLVDGFWRVLHRAGADIVISAHDHNYERFAPQNPDGESNPDAGIRQFVVGTGGAPLRDFGETQPNSEVRDADTYGVLRLALDAGRYSWEFVPVAGETFRDSGNDVCH